jgi:hypothetical protein
MSNKLEPINNNTEPRRLDGATGETQLRAVTAERDALAAALAERDAEVAGLRAALAREKQTGGSGGSLEPPGPLLTHLHTVHTAYSERLPTRLNPLAERTCFSQVLAERRAASGAEAERTPSPGSGGVTSF